MVRPDQLAQAIRRARPDQTDDGASDLSLAITAQRLDVRLPHTAQDAVALLAHRYQRRPCPETGLIRLERSIATLRRLTVNRLASTAAEGGEQVFVALGPSAHDRRLYVCVPATHPLATGLPAGGQRRNGSVAYGLSHAEGVLAWAAAQGVESRITDGLLREARARCAGHVTVTLRGGEVHALRVTAAHDPDRARESQRIPTRTPVSGGDETFEGGVALEVLDLAARHCLEVHAVRGAAPARVVARPPHGERSPQTLLNLVHAPA